MCPDQFNFTAELHRTAGRQNILRLFALSIVLVVCLTQQNTLANRRAALWRVRVERLVSLNTAKNTKCTLTWSVTFRTNIL